MENDKKNKSHAIEKNYFEVEKKISPKDFLENISKEDFKSIWKGKTYSQFRSQLLKGRKEIDICKNCSEGTKVWA